MSGKYAFSQTLKEVRFLFCQTGEKSAGARFVALFPYYPSRGDYCYAWNWKGASFDCKKCKLTDFTVQNIPSARIPNNEEEQPTYPNHAPRSCRDTSQSIRAIWSVYRLYVWPKGSSANFHTLSRRKRQNAVVTVLTKSITEFGKEKSEELSGLSDKEIEEKVTGLVKSSA
jgi:hypothetical protein